VSDFRLQDLRQRIDSYLLSRGGEPEPLTVQEYFTLVLGGIARSIDSGDYGISAVLAFAHDGVEVISMGRNSMLSTHDPLGHAEVDAIRGLRDFLRSGQDERRRTMSPWTDVRSAAFRDTRTFVRPVPRDHPEGLRLFTSLEPCPMCTVAIMNSAIREVYIACADEFGGALSSERLAGLPAIWPEMARIQRTRTVCLSEPSAGGSDRTDGVPDDPASGGPTLSAALVGLLRDSFRLTKDDRDGTVAGGVLLTPGAEQALPPLLETLAQTPAAPGTGQGPTSRGGTRSLSSLLA
jgi:tRNA(Arg) A34 adenosine deaminase TadA